MSTSDITITVPDWLRRQADALPSHIPDENVLMSVLNDLAAQNVAEGTGGPFAAAVAETESGKIVAVGTNLVLASNLAVAHAELVTLGLAQTKLGTWDLSADGVHRTLYVTAQPCAMCNGAVVWSGVSGLDFAATGREVEELTGFDEGPVSEDWKQQLESRGIRVRIGRGANAAKVVLEEFGRQARGGEAVLYNARA